MSDFIKDMSRWMIGDGMLEVIDSTVTGQCGLSSQARVGEMSGASGQAIVKGQPGLQTRERDVCLSHEGQRFRATNKTCPHDIIVVWDCNGACPKDKT